MARKYIDCRDYPGFDCTVALSADNEDELIEACVEHAIKRHGHEDSPELRKELHEMVKEGSPRA